MRLGLIIASFLLALGTHAQNIVGIPTLTQLDTTTFELLLKTDSTAVITVHVGTDSTFNSAFIFMHRTEGPTNEARIKLDRLGMDTRYVYRILVGQEASPFSGTFLTGTLRN